MFIAFEASNPGERGELTITREATTLVHVLAEGHCGHGHRQNSRLCDDTTVHDSLGDSQMLELELRIEHVARKREAERGDHDKRVVVHIVGRAMMDRHARHTVLQQVLFLQVFMLVAISLHGN